MNQLKNKTHPRVIQGLDGHTYHLGKKLGDGSFGFVYEVTDPAEIQGHAVCVKLEAVVKGKSTLLQMEQRAFAEVNRSNAAPYFPKVESLMLSEDGQWRFLVIEQGGPDLLKMLSKLSTHAKLRCLFHCVMGLKLMHDECGLLHRDIKPENIVLRKDRKGIMLIDLGFVKRFRVGPDGAHIPHREKNTLNGTLNYASVHTLLQTESARRDDMESLCYTFVVIMNKHALPWADLTTNFAQMPEEKFDLWKAAAQIASIKRSSTPEKVVGAEGPQCLLGMLRSARSLRFTERPPYEQYLEWIQEDLRNSE